LPLRSWETQHKQSEGKTSLAKALERWGRNSHCQSGDLQVLAYMMDSTPFHLGDMVIHQRRLEWGEGIVQHARRITHEGKTAQRLVVTFTHHGRVTINTAIAPLMMKGVHAGMTRSTQTDLESAAPNGGWLGSLGDKPQAESQLWRLSETMTDPFASIGSRLLATLDSYRFSTEPRSLTEWAIAQTGLADPLSMFTRHELERGFARFARDRDQHLLAVVRQIKREVRHNLLDEALKEPLRPAARETLLRAIKA